MRSAFAAIVWAGLTPVPPGIDDPGAFAFRMYRRGEAEETHNKPPHFLFSPVVAGTIYPDDFPEIENVAPRGQPISRHGKDLSGDAR